MIELSCEQFIIFCSEEKKSCDICNKQSYKSWSNIAPEELSKLATIGVFEDREKYIAENGYEEFHSGKTNYWSEDAPIAIKYYPYHESTIKRCECCKALFLHYVETSGHGPQQRIRWCNPSLISCC